MYQLLKSAYAAINKLVVKSVSGNEVSATRVQSYLILGPIQMMILVVVGIELASFIHGIYTTGSYVLSSEFIVTFGMVLSHHLAILFSRSKSQSINEIKGGQSETEVSTKTTESTQVTTDVVTDTTTKSKGDAANDAPVDAANN